MKNKRINIFLFKIKFFFPRIISSFYKKKIKNEFVFSEFKLLVRGKKFSTFWFLNNCKIVESFLPKDRNETFKYLEIGSFEGLSSFFILSFWKNAIVTCVDTWKISKDKSQLLDYNFDSVEKKFDSNLKGFSYRKIKSTSELALKQLKETDSFDFIYIDGSHNGIDIYNDAVAAFDVLNIDGIIIFDDVTNIYEQIEMQPHDAFEKFYNLYKKNIKILYLKNIAVIKKTSF